MQLSQHFSLDEFTYSSTALRLGINNELPMELYGNAKRTALMLERVRHHLAYLAGNEVPVQITSGYRCLELNRRIGSSDGSDHVQALAADIKVPGFGSAREIALALAAVQAQLGIGQLIYEFGSWVHVSCRSPKSQVNALLTINASGVRTGVV